MRVIIDIENEEHLLSVLAALGARSVEIRVVPSLNADDPPTKSTGEPLASDSATSDDPEPDAE